MKVDFSGFKGMVNALGGVEICLPKAVHDRDSKLNLSAGRHLVKGEQALAYVRNRHGLGDGSDLGRIKRQQLFMSSIVKKVTDGGLLKSPTKLFNFLNAATKSVTTDDGLDIGVIRKLAGSVQGMSAGKVKFVTVPNEPYPADTNRVQFQQPLAGRLFNAIKSDNITKADQSAQTKKKKVKPTVPASQIQVRVLNGTGRAGLAAQVAAGLKAKGYHVVKVGNTPEAGVSKSTIHYGTAGAKAMPTLQNALKTVRPKKVASATTARLDLIIGADWGGLKGGDIPANITGVQGNANICKNND